MQVKWKLVMLWMVFEPQEDRLPCIEDGSIDIVISMATIEHVINPYAVLDELTKVIAHEGYLICSVPNLQYLSIP